MRRSEPEAQGHYLGKQQPQRFGRGMRGSIGPQFMPNLMPTRSTMDSIDGW
jgi:hypothetical protein